MSTSKLTLPIYLSKAQRILVNLLTGYVCPGFCESSEQSLDCHIVCSEKRKMFRTIIKEDVGKMLFDAFESKWRVADFMGRILTQDIGKRVYRKLCDDKVTYILQVENDEQMENRIKSESVK